MQTVEIDKPRPANYLGKKPLFTQDQYKQPVHAPLQTKTNSFLDKIKYNVLGMRPSISAPIGPARINKFFNPYNTPGLKDTMNSLSKAPTYETNQARLHGPKMPTRNTPWNAIKTTGRNFFSKPFSFIKNMFGKGRKSRVKRNSRKHFK